MILVIIGLTRGFPRLVKKMDEISALIDKEVIIQRGKTNYKPKNSNYFDFIDEEEYKALCEKASMFVCHAGVGTIISLLRYNVPIVIVPRKQEYGEHLDNHQMELAKELEKDERIIVCYNENELEVAIKDASNVKSRSNRTGKLLVKNLKRYLTELDVS